MEAYVNTSANSLKWDETHKRDICVNNNNHMKKSARLIENFTLVALFCSPYLICHAKCCLITYSESEQSVCRMGTMDLTVVSYPTSCAVTPIILVCTNRCNAMLLVEYCTSLSSCKTQNETGGTLSDQHGKTLAPIVAQHCIYARTHTYIYA